MAKPFFWLDMEMTGLDEKTDSVLEVAVIITDTDLKRLDEKSWVVFQPPAVLEGMNDWCKKHHGESGLTAAVPTGKPIAEVEAQLLELYTRYYQGKVKDDRIVLVGNSIGNDRRFIDRYFPSFASKLHYRMIDVSSWKEVFRECYGIEHKKKSAHRAVDDIIESIEELKHYLSYVKIPTPTP